MAVRDRRQLCGIDLVPPRQLLLLLVAAQCETQSPDMQADDSFNANLQRTQKEPTAKSLE